MRFAAVIVALFLLHLPAVAEPCAVLARQVDAAGGGAGFIASYPVSPDKALRNVAFLYDNAAAALALIGCGDLGRAGRIGDAILAAQAQDRFWKDGRLRNGYLAGPVKNPAQLGGWQDGSRWVEDGYQVGSDTGNLAWAMLALLGLHHAGAGDRYLTGAIRIAAYVEKSFDPPGFTGGTFGGEPVPKRNSWKSTEHNVDLAAAFSELARATRDPHWAQRAGQAHGLQPARAWTERRRTVFWRWMPRFGRCWRCPVVWRVMARHCGRHARRWQWVMASPIARQAVRCGPKALPRRLC